MEIVLIMGIFFSLVVPGHHVIRFAIHGEGAVASVFRKVFMTFSSEHQIARVSSNKRKLTLNSSVGLEIQYLKFLKE